MVLPQFRRCEEEGATEGIKTDEDAKNPGARAHSSAETVGLGKKEEEPPLVVDANVPTAEALTQCPGRRAAAAKGGRKGGSTGRNARSGRGSSGKSRETASGAEHTEYATAGRRQVVSGAAGLEAEGKRPTGIAGVEESRGCGVEKGCGPHRASQSPGGGVHDMCAAGNEELGDDELEVCRRRAADALQALREAAIMEDAAVVVQKFARGLGGRSKMAHMQVAALPQFLRAPCRKILWDTKLRMARFAWRSWSTGEAAGGRGLQCRQQHSTPRGWCWQGRW